MLWQELMLILNKKKLYFQMVINKKRKRERDLCSNNLSSSC
jgi:hypothetical protein